MTVKPQQASAKGAQSKALTVLAPMAREINVRMEKAIKADGQANDHRLAAALQLGKAKTHCDEHKVNFKAWCVENLQNLTYESARKLVAVGLAPEPMKALVDMRAEGAARVAKHRAQSTKPAKPQTLAPIAPVQAPKQVNNEPAPALVARETITAQSESFRRETAQALAKGLGLHLAPKEQIVVPGTGTETLLSAFKGLLPGERVKFLTQAVELVPGYSLAYQQPATPKAESIDQVADEMPAFLKRSDKPETPAEKPRRRRGQASV